MHLSLRCWLYGIDRSGKQQKQSDWNIRLAVNPPTDPIPDAVMSCYCCNQSEARRTAVWLVHYHPFNGYSKPQITPHQKLPNGVNCDLYVRMHGYRILFNSIFGWECLIKGNYSNWTSGKSLF